MLIYIVSFIVGTGYVTNNTQLMEVEQVNFLPTHFLNPRSKSPIKTPKSPQKRGGV